MKTKVQNIELLKRKLEVVGNFCELPTKTQSQKELVKFAESLMEDVNYDSLNDIEKKYLNVLNDFDYDLIEIKGTGYFVLYDRQCAAFHHYNLVDNIESAVNDFGENWFEDHSLDMDKVFNDKVTDFSECILEAEF